jgi:HSP20 family protein
MDIRDLMPWNWPQSAPSERVESDDPLRSLQTDINRAFESFWQRLPAPRFRAGWDMSFDGGAPPVNIAETEKELEVTIELPGVDEGDIEVALSDSVMTITGEKRLEREDRYKEYYLSERSFGAFRRVIPLPLSVDEDQVHATFKNGVLTVAVPKTEESKKHVRRITVNKG